MIRPLELEALVAQKRVHRSGCVLQAAARPSPPGPLSPLSTKGRGGARGIGAITLHIKYLHLNCETSQTEGLPFSPCTQGENGLGDEGRAAVGSAHAAMMRPLELEALVAQKRVHRSGCVLQAAARPSPPGPLSPLSTKGRGGVRGMGAITLRIKYVAKQIQCSHLKTGALGSPLASK